MCSSMKKTFYYNYLPTKEEELTALATKRPYQVTRTVVEIRDDLLPPPTNPTSASDPSKKNNTHQPYWRIRKRLETHEVAAGKIHLTHEQVFEHVFRQASLATANEVAVRGGKVLVTVCDITEEHSPVVYGPNDEQTFFEKGAVGLVEENYVLGLNMAMVRSRGLKKDDEVGVSFYEFESHSLSSQTDDGSTKIHRSPVFYFKVFLDQ